MSLTFRLAWRNLWRHPRRTWLTTGAMIFSNVILVFMISMQVGMYQMMIDNSLRVSTGHLQVQAQGYNEEQKIRQVVPDVEALAERQQVVNQVATRKTTQAGSLLDPQREQELLTRLVQKAEAADLDGYFVVRVFREILAHSVRRQQERSVALLVLGAQQQGHREQRYGQHSGFGSLHHFCDSSILDGPN